MLGRANAFKYTISFFNILNLQHILYFALILMLFKRSAIFWCFASDLSCCFSCLLSLFVHLLHVTVLYFATFIGKFRIYTHCICITIAGAYEFNFQNDFSNYKLGALNCEVAN